jgi:glyoxylase-like metal-dependent hydrolase (beta-lactamase superfamily II)
VRPVSLPRDGVPTGTVNAHLHEGPETLLLDPGVDCPALDDALAAVAVDHVAVTHAHPDHVGAVARVARETGATVWAARGHEPRFRAATGVDPDRTLADGDTLAGATVLATPGHAPDHLAFLTDAGAACGDLAVASGSVAVAAPDGDLRAYLASLRRLRLRDPPRLFPGHGPVADDARATLDRLHDHRRDRERRVLAAVRAGARDPDATLARAYDADLTGVRARARATVVAHLEKLAAEGRVRWDPATGTVRPA